MPVMINNSSKHLHFSKLWKQLYNRGYHNGPRVLYPHRSQLYSGICLIKMNRSPNLQYLSNKVKEEEPIKTQSIKNDEINNQNVIITETPSRREKLQKAVKEYGSTVIIFHVGMSLVSLGTSYLLVSAGLDSSAVFNVLGLKEWAENSQLAANAGTFAVAYAIHKVFAPVRITITLAAVPFIVRYLRRVGFLKK
ncbi:unnamed protein product [Phaedon cochleariae]|uniref:DUF1279 domain-containing protein n=1 Tax=Phaedon cochleariae TaxID=80249 RepID=A0A9P0GUP6_PHACE|nr:unnamed protein product [Phaedon cochleariae]